MEPTPVCSWTLPQELTSYLFIGLHSRSLDMFSCVSQSFAMLAGQARVRQLMEHLLPVNAIKLTEENCKILLAAQSKFMTNLNLNGQINNEIFNLVDSFSNLKYATIYKVNALDLRKFFPCQSLMSIELSHCNFLESQNIKELTSLPCFKNLTTLGVTGNKIVDEQVKYLIKNNVNLSIQHLCLNNNKITSKGILRIANHPFAANLLTLKLRKNPIGNIGAQEILQKCTNLTTLDLCQVKIKKLPKFEMTIHEHLSKLSELDISYNQIGDAGIEFFTSIPMPNLIQLELAKICSNKKGTRHLAETTNLSKLEFLDYSENSTKNALSLFGSSTTLTTLTELHLWNCHLSDHSVTNFFKSNNLKHLIALYLDDNMIDYTLLQKMANSQANRNIQMLGLSSNLFTCTKIFQNAYFSQLTELHISNNYIRDVGVLYITEAKSLANVTDLNISFCKLTFNATHYLKSSTFKLNKLDISNNKIRNAGAENLAKLNLRELIAAKNAFEDKGALHFACSSALRHLAVLDIRHNVILPSTLETLQKSKFLAGCLIKADVEK